MIKYCRVCGDELNNDNWLASNRKNGSCICRECQNERSCLWQKENPEKARAISTRSRRKRGQLPMSENKECPSFLGVHIAERVLRHAYNDVEMMPANNPGYDFVCNKGMLIDGKSSCFGKDGRWKFFINHNPIADYFLCLAFDNRDDLNLLYAWLLPGEKFNHLMNTGISPSTIHKWDEYKLDISKISACCNEMKNEGSHYETY